ncbi:MAG TPA: kelch repeat-containing protein [Vicinamibacteria bacterium]|nr:kelch repeat-containing protein [Vicinamibacteria bacterium]
MTMHGRNLTRSLALAGTLTWVAACTTESTAPRPSSSPTGDVWVPLPSLLEARQEVGVALLGGRVYVLGGYRADASTAATVEVFDPTAGRWSLAAPMPRGVNHPMVATLGTRLYVFGGDDGLGPIGATQEYDPATNSWQLRAPMPTARSAGLAAAIGSRIYVVGGAPDTAGRVLEAYEPEGDRWIPSTPMPTPRNHLAGGVIGGRLHVVGGRPPATLSVHEVFDPANGSWTTAAPLPTGRSGHGAAVVRDCLYVFGGEGNPAGSTGVFDQNEVYNSRLNSWAALAPMPTPRHGIGAVAIEGRIYVPGGATRQGLGAVAAVEAYETPSDRTCS